MQVTGFTSINLGNIVTVATIVVSVLALRLDFNKRTNDQKKEHDEYISSQAKMHAENQFRLESMMQFQRTQLEVNSKRDQQVGELQRQTATIIEIAKAIDRRVQMLEDKT